VYGVCIVTVLSPGFLVSKIELFSWNSELEMIEDVGQTMKLCIVKSGFE
jgi:hypothetical protein